jgi:hypothetical protein
MRWNFTSSLRSAVWGRVVSSLLNESIPADPFVAESIKLLQDTSAPHDTVQFGFAARIAMLAASCGKTGSTEEEQALFDRIHNTLVQGGGTLHSAMFRIEIRRQSAY